MDLSLILSFFAPYNHTIHPTVMAWCTVIHRLTLVLISRQS